MKDIGSRLRLLREKHGLKQVNLANALQVTPQAVSKWEKGANLPDVHVLTKIARLFDVSTDYILGLTFGGLGNAPMTVQLNNIIGSQTGERQFNVEMAATLMTAAVPLLIYIVSGRWFVRGITAGAVKG